MTSKNLWSYYGDEIDDDLNENNDDNYMVNNETTTSKSFEYKTKILGSTIVIVD